MIKRRFYKLEHGGKDEPSQSGSSSSSSSLHAGSESESEAEASAEEFESGGEAILAPPQLGEACSTSSGYESGDSSGHEVDIDSSGLPINDDDDEDDEIGNESRVHVGNQLSEKKSNDTEENEEPSTVYPDCVLKCKTTFKCRICPRIVCLNEESLMAHLKSKRHSRSEKLQNEGRLKATLNSDGEIDHEDPPSPKEKIDVATVPQGKRKKEKGGRQRQNRRKQMNKLKQKKVEIDSEAKTKPFKEKPAKKKQKREK